MSLFAGDGARTPDWSRQTHRYRINLAVVGICKPGCSKPGRPQANHEGDRCSARARSTGCGFQSSRPGSADGPRARLRGHDRRRRERSKRSPPPPGDRARDAETRNRRFALRRGIAAGEHSAVTIGPGDSAPARSRRPDQPVRRPGGRPGCRRVLASPPGDCNLGAENMGAVPQAGFEPATGRLEGLYRVDARTTCRTRCPAAVCDGHQGRRYRFGPWHEQVARPTLARVA